jgi:long-subunit fatty acid transport protein
VRAIRASNTFDNGTDSDSYSATTLAVGPVIGGEYPISDRFALGAEVGAQYLTFSEDSGFDDDRTQSGLTTTASITARLFLWSAR